MSFALPSALLLAAVAVPIIVCYILKVRLRRVPISTNLFWKQIYREKPPRSIWKHLRHLLSLLVQLLLLSLLVLAAADPYFSWQTRSGRRVVLVIDRSASMQAEDVDPSRFAAARSAALKLIERLSFRDEAAVVAAGGRPEVLCGLTGHLPTLRRTLRSIEVAEGPTQLAPAIALGRQLIGIHPHGQVIVFTDGCISDSDRVELVQAEGGAAASVPSASGISRNGNSIAASAGSAPTAAVPVRYRVFGAPIGNVGITQFQVRRSLVDPLGYEMLVRVRNAGATELACRLEVELADSIVDVVPLQLQPDETWSRTLTKTSLEGGVVTARLTNIDVAREERGSGEVRPTLNGLTIDDTAWGVLPARRVQRVLIVSPGHWFLQKVFEANPLAEVEVRAEFPEQWPAGTIVVLHQQVPAKLPPGPLFVVDPAQGCDLWELGETLEHPLVSDQQHASPLMKHVRLENVLIPEARQLTFKMPADTLAGSITGEPIYAEVRRPEGKCLVLSANLDRGDLAFRTAFPILVTNALGWFAGGAGELRESVCSGAMVAIELDNDALRAGEDLRIVSPRGEQQPLVRDFGGRSAATHRSDAESAHGAQVERDVAERQVRGGKVTIGPLERCGVWRVVRRGAAPIGGASEADDFSSIRVAVNLADERESDLRPDPALREQSAGEWSWSDRFGRPLWYYLAAAGLLLSLVEWALYQRRVIT